MGLSFPTFLVPSGIVPRLDFPFAHMKARSVFERGPDERPLQLIVDTFGLDSKDEAVALLLKLGHHELVELKTTSDVGFPALRFDEVDGKDSMTVWVDYPGAGVGFTGCHGVQWRLQAAEDDARVRGIDLKENRRRYLLAGTACTDVDALVVADTHFAGTAGALANAMTPRQAVALLGLLLRSRGCEDTPVFASGRWLSIRTAIGTQYHRAARASLPAGGRWSRACARAGEASGGEEVAALGGAVMQRLPRCLRARDEVLYQCLVPATKCDRDVLLYHLDALLLMLNGMLDVTAQVANAAHNVGEHPIRVGWRSERKKPTGPLGWRDRLATHAPELFALTSPGTPARHVIEVIALTRNTIHGEPLQGVQVSATGHAPRHLVRVPPRIAPILGGIIEQLGGPEYWGIRADYRHAGGLLLDPLPFVQLLLPLAISALHSIMAATDVQRLPGDQARRWGSTMTEWYETEHIRSICHLAGLGPW
jgi:hypothetical protein